MECIHGARVSAREQISPLMVRVTLQLDEQSSWASTGVGDEFIHLDVGAETLDVDGHSERHYTVSGLIDGGLELEVFLHGDGPGATWGRECGIGDVVTLSDPMEYYSPPAGSGTRILVGDLTALPGIARILADAGADERFRVVVELPAMTEARDLPSAAQVKVDWRVSGNGIGPSAMRDALLSLHRAGEIVADSYVWVACESKESRAARTFLRKEVGLPISQQRIVGYWHANLEQVMAAWYALSDETRAEYLAIWREDRTDEENWLELEPFLQSVGA